MAEPKKLIGDGTMSGGMIPKVETGIEGCVILEGKARHAVLLELSTEHGAGRLIVR